VAPVPVAALVDAVAVIVTTPEAPAAHWKVAVPVPVPVATRVAIEGSELCHPPEYGATKLTGAGDGALLKVPVAVNCTWPMGELSPSAVGGVTFTDCSTRLELDVPHPAVWRTNIPTKKIAIKCLRSGMETSPS